MQAEAPSLVVSQQPETVPVAGKTSLQETLARRNALQFTENAER